MLDPLKRQLVSVFMDFKRFRGNARTCVLVEPMWGIPFNLYVPYASLYMLAIGLNAAQVGMITSIGLAFQMLFSLLGGYVTDRLGRRRTSLIFDLISWTIPTLIWALAQNIFYFLAAVILNSLVRIVHTSWSCLFIEDTRPEDRVHTFTWIAVAGVLSGFFAPVAGLFVRDFGLVPAVRGLYLFAFASMTTMFFLRNAFTRETAVGIVKMKEARQHGLREVFAEYLHVTRTLFTQPATLTAFLLAVLSTITLTFRNTFLGIVLTKGIGIPQAAIALFPAMGSMVIMAIYLFVMPAVSALPLKKSLSLGLGANLCGFLLLLTAPAGSFPVVALATLVGAVGQALVMPLIETNLANAVEDHHRAKIMAVINTLIFGASTPFGYLAGLAAQHDARLPAAMAVGVQALSLVVLLAQTRIARESKVVNPG